MVIVNLRKNRDRDSYSFANINLIGPCNADCFYCIGSDLGTKLEKIDNLKDHFKDWKNFETFLARATKEKIKKIYLTGINTDSLLYQHLRDLIDFLQNQGFGVGLRTNGYLAKKNINLINKCKLEIGYSFISMNPIINNMIVGRKDIPDWENVISKTINPRISIVINRCNYSEFFRDLRYLSKFKNIQYIQVRRVSSDTREELLMPDMVVYEELYSKIRDIFPIKKVFAKDAEVFEIYGLDVVFWRTIKTSVNSMNYFTNGIISDSYFLIEGYLKSLSR